MSVRTEEVEKIAELARLRFEPGELERFIGPFQQILDYFHQLDGVVTRDVKPMYHASGQDLSETPMREDRVGPSLKPEVALDQAPDPGEGQFRVPRVIE